MYAQRIAQGLEKYVFCIWSPSFAYACKRLCSCELSPGTIHYFQSNQAAIYKQKALVHEGAITCRASPFVHLVKKDDTC